MILRFQLSLSLVGRRRPLFFAPEKSRGGLWELTARLSRLVERYAAREYAPDRALLEESLFGRSQTPKSGRLRQPLRWLIYDLHGREAAQCGVPGLG
jgi:hypothetical protein